MLAVITPVKNEAKSLLHIAKQLTAQTLIPKLWLIVDDGSTDATPSVMKELEEDYEFILDISLNKRSSYDEVFRYGYVVRAGFNYVLDFFRELKFLGVLDVDTKLKRNYYEEVMNAFNNVPRLGIASGLYFGPRNNTSRCFVLKKGQKLSICGAAMTFKRECLLDIGGFPACPRPDTVALLKAANREWKIGVVPSTYAIHLRANCSLSKYVKLGFASYVLGYHPLNALVSGPYMTLKNLSLSPLGFTAGYVMGAAKNNVIADEEIRRYFHESFLRRFHKLINILSFRKNVDVDPIENSVIKL